jgi:hypothetical protein
VTAVLSESLRAQLLSINPLWQQFEWRGPTPGHLGAIVTDQPVLIQQPNLIAYVSQIEWTGTRISLDSTLIDRPRLWLAQIVTDLVDATLDSARTYLP